MTGTRPHDLGLKTLRLPVGAYASILHRITGVLLVAAVGLGLAILHASLRDARGFQAVAAAVRGPWGHVIGPLAAWAAAQHLYGGIRHLAQDAGLGFGRGASRATATAVLGLAALTGLWAVFAWP